MRILEARLTLATLFHTFSVFFGCLYAIMTLAVSGTAQPRSYPKAIRGYKVEHTAVETKPPEKRAEEKVDGDAESNREVDQLIKFGPPQVARVTPLGITFEVPIVIAPVKQSGHVEFLTFENMRVNDHAVEIEEYRRSFDLPNKRPLTLKASLRFYIYLPAAVLAAANEWSDSKEIWPVTGRVYVFGKFKKGLFSFKRSVPVELNLTMRNPLRVS